MPNSNDSDPVVAELERLTALGRERMIAADPALVGMRPAELDWLTHVERAEHTRLILLLPRSGEIQQAARERVARKRAERVRAMSRDFNEQPPDGDAFDHVFAGVTSDAIDELINFVDPNANATLEGFEDDPHFETTRALIRASDELKARGR